MTAYPVREECDERTGEYRENEAGKDRDPLQVTGPNACNLSVGHLMVPSYAQDDTGNLKAVLYIFEDPDRMSIIEGDGDDRIMQQFFIRKNEVVPE